MKKLERKLQCFISSTYDDMRDERMCCIDAILDSGHIPTGMEYFRAGKMQKEIIKKYIQESDVVFLILGGRYGTIDPETKVSYVEWEYNYASEKNKIIIPMILEENYLYQKEAKFKVENKDVSVFQKKFKKRNSDFHKRVKEEVGECAFIGKLDDIRHEVMRNITGILIGGDDRITGWIKYDPHTVIHALESDLADIPKENRKRLMRELMIEQIASKGSRRQDIVQIAGSLSDVLDEYENMMQKYIHSFSRYVNIELKDEYIEITNRTNITYVTPNSAEGMFFKWNPWLYEGIESKTYHFTEISYNGKRLPLDMVEKGEMKPTDNPFYVKDVITLNIPFDEQKTEHRFQYQTKYCVDYDRFFHEYVFSELCNIFSLNIDLVDSRGNKEDKEYMLKWGMFTPHKSKGFSSKSMLTQTKNKIVFNVSDLMLPGTGYIVTLSSAKPGVIKSYSI